MLDHAWSSTDRTCRAVSPTERARYALDEMRSTGGAQDRGPWSCGQPVPDGGSSIGSAGSMGSGTYGSGA